MRRESQAELVQYMRSRRLISRGAIEAAFLKVDRSWFVPREFRDRAYADHPLPIGHNVTISAPHMHAMMAELMAGDGDGSLDGATVLDVGSGTGYLTAILALMVGPRGKVIGVDHESALVEAAQDTCKAHLPEVIASGQLSFRHGDGRKGVQDMAFDAIHVGAAADGVPKALLQQLKPRGRLVIPVGAAGDDQVLCVITKADDGLSTTSREVCGVRFVPLCDIERQRATPL